MQPSPTHVRKRVVLVPTVARHPFFFSFLKTQFLTGTVLKSVKFPQFLLCDWSLPLTIARP
jgi:hypothetical protein